MNNVRSWLVMAWLAFQSCAWAVVRSITVDQSAMAEIHLSMGRSTVLHFFEKPTKVIAGNQNYFNIEFTGEDVTLQPLGPVTSNIFVYTEYHRYGFVLRVGGSSGYDDLVQVRWRSSTLMSPLTTRFKEEMAKEERSASKEFEALLKKAFFDKELSLHVFEVEIRDKKAIGFDSKSVALGVTAGGKPLAPKRIVFDKEVADSKDPVLRARIFLEDCGKKRLSLKIKIDARKTAITLPLKVAR